MRRFLDWLFGYKEEKKEPIDTDLYLLHKSICPTCRVKGDFLAQQELSVPQTVTCCNCGAKHTWWPPGFSTEGWTLRPDLLGVRKRND